MCHNARLQHLVRVVCSVINAFALSLLPYYDLFMLARSALSQPCLQHFNGMCAGGYVMK